MDHSPPRASGSPKVELHIHIEGTLEPDLIFELAERNNVRLPYTDIDDLKRRYEFSDLQSFLNLYYANLTVLQHAVDFTELTDAYLARAQSAGVRHAEIFFDPQAHTSRGVELGTALEGVATSLQTSEERFGISTGLIVCFLRDRPPAEALDVLERVLASGVPVLGVGLDSAEVGFPPSLFTEVFARAKDAGLRLVAHAGEEGPSGYIVEALDLLGAERIDHGIRCLDDDALVERLVTERIPLTVCPLSNVRLRAVDMLAGHPLPVMLERGLAVCINSDDPAYFGGYIDDVYNAVEQSLGLSADALDTLTRNAITGSFASDERKASLLAELS
ncbi:adenosine deaminase [Okibacterium endophyticum]